MDWGEPSSRTRERRGPTMRPPSRLQTRIALVLVAAAVGFLVGVQARSSEQASNRLAAESPEDLTRILADLNAEADRLAEEVSDLQVRLSGTGLRRSGTSSSWRTRRRRWPISASCREPSPCAGREW